ncbi:M23 family metallopeptidase [Eubacterium sp. MSJ-13]|uniref:M23 family metallopeptidase n=1 Tax=Eubacterium sp. MSJ-13 TaxID=2841513 RepID=UPI001C1294CE|nr:M23 family metallopeptidase [Eubacterium sp. MSJ-13]MBU5478549.1 M23 family metallopeptidase [Eubacterium sp. MSJ-13]
MKRTMKKNIFMATLVISFFIGILSFWGDKKGVSAATRKCYTINNYNTRVFSNTGLSRGIGWIYPSDECYVYLVTGSYSKVAYPTARGLKTGYISTSAILTATGGTTYTSRGKFNTYRRDGGSYYGYVAVGDSVMVLGTRGEYTQIKYPVSGGYKYGFATTSDVNTYLMPQQVNNVNPVPEQNTDSLAAPVPSGCKFNKKTNDNGWFGYHDINIGVSLGTPVYAISDGVVTYKQAYRTFAGIKYLTSYGNFIEFKSSYARYTAKYCHLNGFAGANQIISSSRTIRRSGNTGLYNCGSRNVKKGEVIGYIGKTGNATGVHLHFELRKDGGRIDPTDVIGGLR